MNPLENQTAFYVGSHPYHFCTGEPALIVGVVVVTPRNAQPRPCLALRYADGFLDQTPVEEAVRLGCIYGEKELTVEIDILAFRGGGR